MKVIKRLILLVFIILQVGCCTVYTQRDMHDWYKDDKGNLCLINETSREWLGYTSIYSGTYFNVANILLYPFRCEGDGCMYVVAYPVFLVGGLIDLPLDLVADTVMLPYTVPLTMSVDCDHKKIDK
ncbi:MAG TPA: YceK/YidQ family lipoprotein [Geobacteraceae bacterium]